MPQPCLSGQCGEHTFQEYSTFEEITVERPSVKRLIEPLRTTGGRNAYGRITCRHKGGGHKRHYRVIDFRRNKDDIPAKVAAIEYDPNRSARIALLFYADGEKRYILAPVDLKVGDTVMSGQAPDVKPGNTMPLSNIPLGTEVHNIELKLGKGGQIVRSAGAAVLATANGAGRSIGVRGSAARRSRRVAHAPLHRG